MAPRSAGAVEAAAAESCAFKGSSDSQLAFARSFAAAAEPAPAPSADAGYVSQAGPATPCSILVPRAGVLGD